MSIKTCVTIKIILLIYSLKINFPSDTSVKCAYIPAELITEQGGSEGQVVFLKNRWIKGNSIPNIVYYIQTSKLV